MKKYAFLFLCLNNIIILSSCFQNAVGTQSKPKCMPIASKATGMDAPLANRLKDIIDNGDSEKLEMYLKSNSPNLNVVFESPFESVLEITLDNLKDNLYRPNDYSKYFKVLEVLLKFGADPNANKCSYNYLLDKTTITNAITHADFSKDLQDYLISKSISVDFNRTMLEQAVFDGNISLIEKFGNSLQKVDVSHLIHYSIKNSQFNSEESIRAIKIFVTKGANINEIFHSDYVSEGTTTPLMRAIAKQDFAVVKFLLENGANPNLTGNGQVDGFAPLHAAIAFDNIPLVKLILELGGNFKQRVGFLSLAKSEEMKDFLFLNGAR